MARTYEFRRGILGQPPRLPTMRVIGSQDMRTRFGLSPDMRASHLPRHSGSLFSDALVKFRRARTVRPYVTTAVLESLAPGGSSRNGMNLSGKPGIVQPMQMPPTFGQPPTPLIQPRFGTLHLTTGPQQPSLTRHLGEPYSPAKSPSS